MGHKSRFSAHVSIYHQFSCVSNCATDAYADFVESIPNKLDVQLPCYLHAFIRGPEKMAHISFRKSNVLHKRAALHYPQLQNHSNTYNISQDILAILLLWIILCIFQIVFVDF